MSEEKKSRGTLYDVTRTILLAAVGAASLAQDELTHFVDRLVERGEMAESDARKLVKEVMDRRSAWRGNANSKWKNRSQARE